MKWRWCECSPRSLREKVKGSALDMWSLRLLFNIETKRSLGIHLGVRIPAQEGRLNTPGTQGFPFFLPCGIEQSVWAVDAQIYTSSALLCDSRSLCKGETGQGKMVSAHHLESNLIEQLNSSFHFPASWNNVAILPGFWNLKSPSSCIPFYSFHLQITIKLSPSA